MKIIELILLYMLTGTFFTLGVGSVICAMTSKSIGLTLLYLGVYIFSCIMLRLILGKVITTFNNDN